MTTLTRADWEQRARDLKIEGRAYLNGEYTDAVSGETFECISPVDGRLLGKIASCDAADAQIRMLRSAPSQEIRQVALQRIHWNCEANPDVAPLLPWRLDLLVDADHLGVEIE